MQRLSLAQQIAQLEDVAPVDFDPEDIQVTGTHLDPDLVTVADNNAARAHYIDVGPSSLRKLHDSHTDPKYDAAKTSRRMLEASSDSDFASDSCVSEEYPEPRTLSYQSAVERNMGTRIVINGSTERRDASLQNGDLPSSLHKMREDDRQKGRAISRQIALWDSLLDARIRLQKSVTAGNRLLPLSQITVDEQVDNSLMQMLVEAQLLSDEIFDFQERLLLANESIRPPPRKRRRSTENDYSVINYAEELRQASHAASELESTYHAHLVQTLNKWSSKIQAVAPSVLLPSNRNAFSKPTQHIKSAPQLIDETLADHAKVLARTRIYRGKTSRLGDSATYEDEAWPREDSELFDDIDFYHQLLRDIIDARGNGNDHWMAAQKEKKAKKKVDTKASKGRKLRYEVHEKMQNFMVPVLTQGSWHEEQIDELFGSLLGKGFESAMQDAGETVDQSLQEEVDAALQGGFRIFG